MLGKLRRGRWPLQSRKDGVNPEASAFDDDSAPPPESAPANVGWDLGPRSPRSEPASTGREELRAQILSLLADPRVDGVTVPVAAKTLGRPVVDVETTMDAMVQAGELLKSGGATKHYRVSTADKERLEALFCDAAHELGEVGVLARTAPGEEALATLDDEAEEPRLPVTAGLLSLFLPGTGQLLNGDVGRASLVFAVWSLAWITHLSPVWTFVCLYAGAEAFFTAKIRSMERKLAKEALGPAGAPPRQLYARPSGPELYARPSGPELPPAKPSET